MARRLANFKAPSVASLKSISFGAPAGVDSSALPQTLDPNLAVEMVNYIPEATGVLNTRRGAKTLATIAAITGYQKLEWYWGENFLAGHGTTLVWVQEGGTTTNIKTNFASDVTDILTYGDYAFVASGNQGDKIHRVSMTLAFSGQTVNFTVGEIITGGTSGATARVLEVVDAGATGTLTLGEVTGTFANLEALTGSLGGNGNVVGTLTMVATSISAAPKANVLHTVVTPTGNADARLIAGATDEGVDVIYYSTTDTGTNPPFSNWTVGTAATAAGKIRFGKAGTVKSISDSEGDLFVGYANGRAQYPFSVLDSGGTLVQDVAIRFQSLDYGVQRGATGTSFGVFYLNESGLRAHTSSSNDPIQSIRLDREYFADVDFTQSEVIHDPKQNLILATYAKDSTTNNEVLAYRLDTKAVFFFSGWSIASFAKKSNGDIYGVSAIDGKFFKLFEGFTDDGKSIYTTLTQEVNLKTVTDVFTLEGLEMQAILFEDEPLTINFDIYNDQGGKVDGAGEMQIVGTSPSSQLHSWGSTGYGTSGWTSGSGGLTLTPQIYTTDDLNLEFYRLAVRIISANKTPHTLNWRALKIARVDGININNITKIS